MNATELHPICMAMDFGFTLSRSKMHVQVWRVAACQVVSGSPARPRAALKFRRVKCEWLTGLPTVFTNTRASPLTAKPSAARRSRWRSRAYVAFLANPTLRRLALVLGPSKVYPPLPLTSDRWTCITRRDRSKSDQNSPVNSPQRAPEVSPSTYNAWYLSSDSAAARNRLASSRLSGRIAGGSTRGGETSLQTLRATRRHRTALFSAADSV